MKLTNFAMETMINLLEPFLDDSELLGYAAARNIRKLQDGCKEYINKKVEIVKKYGEKELDADGNETGGFVVKETAEGFKQAAEELDKFGNIEHEVELFKIPISEAMGKMTGRQILELGFMFEDDHAQDNNTLPTS